MTLRTLGESDLRISRLGIGAWAMSGAKWEFAWGAQDDRDSIAAIRAALDQGMNWIDTAAVYGLGHAEAVIGRALQGLHTRPYVFTKCSMVWDKSGKISHNLQAASIRREAEDSLKRLGVDSIDLYQIHWPAWRGIPGDNTHGSIEEAVGALAKLKDEGKIRHIGVSNFSVQQIRRAQSVAPIASAQAPYSLAAIDIEFSILPYAAEHGIGVIVYSPMVSGLLSGAMTRERIEALPEDDWRKCSPNFREPLVSRNLRLVETLRDIGESLHATPGQVAVAWTLRKPAVTGAIVGVRSAEQVKALAGTVNLQLGVGDLLEMGPKFALQVA